MTSKDYLLNQKDSDYQSDAVQRFCIRLFLLSGILFIIFVVVGGLDLDVPPSIP